MTETYEITQLGASVLRQQSQLVEKFDDSEIKKLIQNMREALANTEGVGLAAPQINQLKRIVIVASRPSVRYPTAPFMNPTVMINPIFQALSGEKEKDWEGCLSIPGIRALVPRYKAIKIQYDDEQGNKIKAKLEGFVARVFQHEIDHLEGKVYLDRIDSPADIIAESEYIKLFQTKVVAF